MSARPHVIYLLSDEHCGTAMSHAGDPNVQTPVMDRLAAQGGSFANAYANCPICVPSRGTIFSGRHAHAGPVQGFFDVFKATAPSTATLLQGAGYHTAYFGKWHCGVIRDQIPPVVQENPQTYPSRWPQRTPEHHRAGFQDWHGFEINNAPFQSFYYHENETEPRAMQGYQTDVLTDLTVAYLTDYDQTDPLFLVLSVEPPHFPLEAPETFLRFDPDALATPPNFADTPEMRRKLAAYYAMIENLDWNLGRLLGAVAQLPRFADNTLVVYLSDHGEFMGAHGLMERKEYPHQESVRIPAIFHWPGHIPHQPPRPELFSLVDLLPTTLGLLGLPSPVHIQGRDFSAALRAEAFTGPDAVLLEMVGNPRWNLDFLDWRGLVTQRWKYAFFESGHELLFDLDADPYEQHNLVESQPTVRDELFQRLLALLAESREPYFDVLMQHPAPLATPIINVNPGQQGGIAPIWPQVVTSTDEAGKEIP